jgi:mannitol/fructose-specific phosphotransferase system IIA component (Ntr-type)
MPKSKMNVNLEIAISHMKKDVVKNGGSCIFIIANDEELLQNGGGQTDLIRHLLTLTIEQMEKDQLDIIRTIPFPPKN